MKDEKVLQSIPAHIKEKFDYTSYSVTPFVRNKARYITVKCKLHDEIKVLLTNHRKCGGCKACEEKEKILKMISDAKEIHNNKYYYLEVHSSYSKYWKILCPEHGIFYQIPTSHITHKQGCMKCGARVRADAKIERCRLYKDSATEELNKIHNNRYDYSLIPSEFSPKDKIPIICSVHGVFYQRYDIHKKKHNCPKCAGSLRGRKAIKRTIDKYKTKFPENSNIIHNNKYDYSLVEYVNNVTPVSIICPIHGVFTQTPRDHIQGCGCQMCAKNSSTSKEEKIIKELFPTFIENDRSVLFPRELDLYSPYYKLAVEINGVYWHDADRIGKFYHLNKSKSCIKKNINLLHFWDYEINNKLPIVESIIKSKIKQTNRIYARNCTIKIVDKQTAKHFINNNHIQGYVGCNIALGLFSGETLCQVMTFGKPRFSKKYDWELLRLCSLLNTTIVGGASKLFAMFLENYSGSIISYADKRISNGNVYKKLGFVYSHTSVPNYSWVKREIILKRYSAQKHKLKLLLGDGFDVNQTEDENMRRNGFNKVYDCGNDVYIFER
mgnify:CR=1 FL=1|jgi:conserved hypothetical protein